MRYVDRQIYANEAIDWFCQFPRLEPWNLDRELRLRELGRQPKPEDVDKIMGLLWTSVQCSQCGKHQPSGIELDVVDAETGDPAVLCLGCVDGASILFQQNETW